MTNKLPNIAILGATGVVGREILNILDEKEKILRKAEKSFGDN